MRDLPKREYLERINSCLPHDIRMLAFAQIDSTFDARFSCIYREYTYFFFGRNMSVSKIAGAARRLVGLHDYRNFCKPDSSIFRPDEEP